VGGEVAGALTGPVLETARLRLRPPLSAGFEPWAACMADAGASRFIGGPLPRPTAWPGRLIGRIRPIFPRRLAPAGDRPIAGAGRLGLAVWGQDRATWQARAGH
jgi:hypothetical protein